MISETHPHPPKSSLKSHRLNLNKYLYGLRLLKPYFMANYRHCYSQKYFSRSHLVYESMGIIENENFTSNFTLHTSLYEIGFSGEQ